MKVFILAASVFAFASSAAFADPIAERKALMKANGKAIGTIAPYVKEEKPFDAAAVFEALKTLSDDAQKLDVATHFPVGSDKGDTTASPAIWQDMAGFQAKIDKFKADTAAAAATPPQDLEALMAAFGALGSNCGGCHEVYRVKKG